MAVATGPRVVLRVPVPSDAQPWAELVAANRDFVRPWIDLPDDDDVQAVFQRTLEQAQDARFEKLWVVAREGGALLGVLNLNEIVRGVFCSAYLGYWISGAHARQGLMREAVALGLGYAFGPLGLHRLEANIQPGNEASKALVRGLGFVQEGFSERYLKIGGQWCDHERWAITVERWQA